MESMQHDTDSYVHLTQGAKTLNDGRNRVYFCELNRYYSQDVFRRFSIKFTLEGEVEYKTENEHYRLLPAYFLLSIKQPCECTVNTTSITRNISIDISHTTLNEVFTTLSNRQPNPLENLQAAHFISPEFFEHQYPAEHSELGQLLMQLGKELRKSPGRPMHFSEETFYVLAEKVIAHENQMHHSLHQLEAVKTSTKKETLKRLLQGKTYMEDSFLQNPTIAEISRYANLSEYYFFRNFRSAFQFSPYQYLLQLRLEHARKLVKQKMLIQDIADACGFPDTPSFSKAYKKKFGFSPSKELAFS
jgi:AraC-like DNA-binding protein